MLQINWLHHAALRLCLLKLCLIPELLQGASYCNPVCCLPSEGSPRSALRFHVFCWPPAWKGKVYRPSMVM